MLGAPLGVQVVFMFWFVRGEVVVNVVGQGGDDRFHECGRFNECFDGLFQVILVLFKCFEDVFHERGRQ